MQVEYGRRIRRNPRGKSGVQARISLAPQDIGYALTDKAWPNPRQLTAFGNRVPLRPGIFLKGTQHEYRVPGPYGIFPHKFWALTRTNCSGQGEFAILCSFAGRLQLEFRAFRVNHDRTGAILQE